MHSLIIGMIIATLAPAHAGSAPDRCVAVQNCLCKVSPGPKPGARVETKIVQRRFAVYFKEDADSLSADQQESRRVDIVVHTKKRITTLIDKVPADFYLVDASGSMWDGYRDWTDVVNASVKPGSKVYLSIMTGCHSGQSISSVTPQGGTEIWWSYWVILDKMRPGQTLAIISDLDSNVPLSRREHTMLSDKAQAKGVNVKFIRP